MNFVRHVACDTDVILKFVHLDGEERATIRIWCTTCKRIVIEQELSKSGPYVASLPKDAHVIG